MKIILNARRHHYVARVSIFLIPVALIAGMVGCGPSTAFCNLTIASTAGGNVTTPGEGTFTHYVGTVVNLTAEAEAGYHFVQWTGNVSTIADVYAASTTITMNGNYEITANFGLNITLIADVPDNEVTSSVSKAGNSSASATITMYTVAMSSPASGFGEESLRTQ